MKIYCLFVHVQFANVIDVELTILRLVKYLNRNLKTFDKIGKSYEKRWNICFINFCFSY